MATTPTLTIAPAPTSETPARARIKPGPKPKDRAPILKTIFAELEAGQTRKAASAFAGITSKTLLEWSKDDPTILDRVELAEGVAERNIVAKLMKFADNGEYAPAMFWLKTRRHADWNERQQLQVNLAHTLDVRHTLAFDPLIAIETRALDVTDLVTQPTNGSANGNGHAADILIG